MPERRGARDGEDISTTPGARLPRAWLARDAATVARELLGQRLVRVLPDGRRLAGVIVETEAYLGPVDRASHAFGGRRTGRNEAMYARAGTAYVYFTYGMHPCVNVVCAEEGDPQAVLIRALRACEGLGAMVALRRGPGRAVPVDTDLCRGPARLCRAMAIDRALNGSDLVEGRALWLERGDRVADQLVARSARVGVEYAGAWASRRLRWYVEGDASVSRGRPARPRGSSGANTRVRRGRLSVRRSQS